MQGNLAKGQKAALITSINNTASVQAMWYVLCTKVFCSSPLSVKVKELITSVNILLLSLICQN